MVTLKAGRSIAGGDPPRPASHARPRVVAANNSTISRNDLRDDLYRILSELEVVASAGENDITALGRELSNGLVGILHRNIKALHEVSATLEPGLEAKAA
ncbi:MAG: hypothetical protein R3C54_05785 [Parvularculaceae bacterium]